MTIEDDLHIMAMSSALQQNIDLERQILRLEGEEGCDGGIAFLLGFVVDNNWSILRAAREGGMVDFAAAFEPVAHAAQARAVRYQRWAMDGREVEV